MIAPICREPAKHTSVPSEARQPRPVDVRRRVDFALVAADERQRIAGARIGHRHARVGEARRSPPGSRARPRTGCPARAGTAPLCRRCRTRTGRPTSAARRSCPSRAFSASRKQIASWSSGFGAAGPTSIRSAPGCASAAAGVHAMVVDDDVRRLEAPLAAHAHERRITGAGADDVDARSIHGSSVVVRRSGSRCLAPNVRIELVEQSPRPVRVQRVGEPLAEPAGIGRGPLHRCRTARIHRATRRRPASRATPSCSTAMAPSGN